MNRAEHQGDDTQAEWTEVEDAAALYRLATILFGPCPTEIEQDDQAEGSAA